MEQAVLLRPTEKFVVPGVFPVGTFQIEIYVPLI